MTKLRLKLLIGVSLFTSMMVKADGVSPYLPVQLNPVFELEVARLVSITGYPTLKQPYHIASLIEYVDDVKDSHPLLYRRLNRYMDRFKTSANITHYKTEIRASNDNVKTLPNSRGRSTESDFYAEFSVFWQLNKYVIANAGGGYADREGFLNFGNYISFGNDLIQADIGYREHWLSPMQDSAMLVSTQAIPMLSVTLSNVKPITDYKISYELSFGQLEEVDGIVFNGATSSGKPGFLTMNLGFKPTDWWTLSLNRTMQFGGGQRGRVNISSIWDAIIDPVGADNCGGESSLQDCNREFGNQQAAIASRFDVTLFNMPASLYMEIAGEDANNYKNYMLGNRANTLGLFFPYWSETESLKMTMQYIEDAWYTHHLYHQGYSNDGHKMGHWWGDEKRASDGIGAITLGVSYTKDILPSSQIRIKYHQIQNKYSESSAANLYERGHYFQLDYNWQYQRELLGLHVYLGKDVHGESFTSLAFSKMW